MQLDRTHVKVRPRSLSEIGDLALMLIRQYPQALLVGFFLGALPWAICNLLLVGWIPLSETLENVYDEETIEQRWRYIWLMTSLVYLQSPLAGAFTTYYIGQAIFEERPPWPRVFRETAAVSLRLIWSLGIVRGAIPAMLLVLSNWGQPLAPGREIFWIFILLLWATAIRSFRPFLPEILLLERCPIWSRGDSHTLSATRRSQLLHNPLGGDLFGRFLLGGSVIALLAVGLFYSFVFLFEAVSNASQWSLTVTLVLLPFALWIAAGFSVLVRFLSYLDCRIRLEGWEVELGLRAEALRQFGGVLLLLGGLLFGGLVLAAPAWAAAEGSGGAEGASAAASSEVAESLESMGSLPWYDPDKGEVAPIEVKPRVDDSVNRNSRWLPKPSQSSATPATPANPGGSSSGLSPTAGAISTAEIVGWMVVGSLMMLVVGLLVYTFLRMEGTETNAAAGAGLPEEREQDFQTRLENLPIEVRRPSGNLLEEADRLAAAGQIDEAIIYLFGHSLLQLDRHHIIRLARGKTNRQYLAEMVGRNELRAIMRETVDVFESSYFGRYEITPEQFARVRASQTSFETLLASLREAA